MTEQNLRMNALVVDKATGPLAHIQRALQNLGKSGSLGGLRRDLASIDAAFGGLSSRLMGFVGLSGGIVGVAYALRQVATSAIDLRHLARETGFATNQAKAFTSAAERMRIAPEQAQQALRTFSETAYKLGLNIEGVRDQLYQQFRGAAPFLNELTKLGREGKTFDAMKFALEGIERLAERDMFAARKLSEALFGDANFARVKSRLLSEEMKRTGQETGAAADQAQRFHDNWLKTEKVLKNIRNWLGNGILPIINQAADKISVASELREKIYALERLKSENPAAYKRQRLEEIDKFIAEGKGNAPLLHERTKLKAELELIERGHGVATAIGKGLKDGEQKIEQEGENAAKRFMRWFMRMSLEGAAIGGPIVVPASLGGVARGSGLDGFRPGFRGPGGVSLGAARERLGALGVAGGASGAPDASNPQTRAIGPMGALGARAPSDAAREVYDTLRAGGLSHSQASAFLGHAEFESGMGARVNAREGAAGLIHWRGSRLAALKQYAASKGEQGIGSPKTQAEFALREMRLDPYESQRAAAFLNNPNASTTEASKALRPYIRYGTDTDAARANLGRQFDQSMGPSPGGAAAGVKGMANYMRGQHGPPGSNLTTVTAPGGAKFTVHKDAAPSFQGFLNELEGSGYTIDPKQSGGYAPRNKAVGGLSQHAYGNAIDINWNRNPYSRNLQTDLPPNVSDMAAKYGLSWGGDWKRIKDAMHFEWTGQRPWLDRAIAAQTQRVEGSGRITVDVNAPRGTRVAGEGKGIFREVEVNRSIQMQPSYDGPPDSFGDAYATP